MDFDGTEPMERVCAIDTEVTHVWMIRTFLKHADEAEEDDDGTVSSKDMFNEM